MEAVSDLRGRRPGAEKAGAPPHAIDSRSARSSGSASRSRRGLHAAGRNAPVGPAPRKVRLPLWAWSPAAGGFHSSPVGGRWNTNASIEVGGEDNSAVTGFINMMVNIIMNHIIMTFLDRSDELRRLDGALRHPGAFAAVWGRRRVGKSRLLVEWARQRDGLYTVADASAAPVQRRYLAEAVAARFPGFAEVEYPDWRSLLDRVRSEAEAASWPGPLVLDEVPYVAAADPSFVGTLRNWLDRPGPRPALVVSGSSHRMMFDAVLGANAPLYGRAAEAFAVRPLRPGYLRDVFPDSSATEQVSLYSLWGGMPRYWELAEPFGTDFEAAMDALVLDPAGALHDEPDHLLRAEMPSAVSLRPLLDVIGAGAHRISKIAGRLEKPASSLSGALAALREMQLVRREVPFGSDPRSGKRSLYRLDDPFLRLWFRVVAPRRSILAAAPRETRLSFWQRARPMLEAYAWEELCRLAVPALHRTDSPLGALGPWEPAQRYWRRNQPEIALVARSVDGRRLLVGEAKWRPDGHASASLAPPDTTHLPDAHRLEVVPALFAGDAASAANGGAEIVGAATVLAALR